MADRSHDFHEAEAHHRLHALANDQRPAILFDRSGTRVVWANGAGAAYLGAATVDRLHARGYAPDSAGARRIATLARQLAAGDERTERLALPRGMLPQPVVCRALRIILKGERCVLLTVVDGTGRLAPDEAARRYGALASSLAPAPTALAVPPVAEDDPYAVAAPAGADGTEPPDPSPEAAPPFQEAVASETAPIDAGTAGPETAAPSGPADDEPVAEPLPEEPATPVASAPEPAEDTPAPAPRPRFLPPADGRMVRFVFELDGTLAFSFLSDEFAAVVGPRAADVVGETWSAAASRLGIDPLERVGGALARRETFTGLTVDWPIEDADLRIPVDLAGMPVFARDRSFRGYRGFGIAKTGALFPAPMVVGGEERVEPADLGTDAAPALVVDTEPETVVADPAPLDEAPSDLGTDWADPAPDLPAETEAFGADPVPASDPANTPVHEGASDALLADEADADIAGLAILDDVPLTVLASTPERPPQPPEIEPGPPEAPEPATPGIPEQPASPDRPDGPNPEVPAPSLPEPAPVPDDVPADRPDEAPAGMPEEAPVVPPEVQPGTLPDEAPAGLPDEVPSPAARPDEASADADAVLDPVSAETDRAAAIVTADARALAEAARDPAAEEPAEPSPRDGENVVIQSPIVARPVPKVVLSEEDLDRRQLSRPEREAFQKIAEALGARLEGGAPASARKTTAARTSATPPAAAPQPAEPGLDEDEMNARQGRFDFGPSAPGRPGEPGLDRTLLDRVPIALAILKDGDAVFVNRAFLDITGYANAAAFEAAGGFAAAFAGSALQRDASLPAVRRRDGVEVPVSAKVHSIGWGDGVASLLIIQETAATTGRERAADSEQRVEELEAILDTATDGVLVIDDIGVVLAANRSAEALFGMERSHMVGAALVSLLAPESHRDALDYIDGLSRNGLSSVLNDGREVIGRVKGGGLVPLFMTAGRVSAQKFCAVLRDITQWKRAEEELTNAKRAAETASSQKSEFLAKISHEIRTPLNAIIGFSEVMMEERFGPVGSDRYKEYLRDIHISGAHIMSLVNDLLDLSKIEAGKLDLSFEAVAPNEVIRECVALMQPQANRERVIIRTSLSSSLPAVVADSRSLRQIVLNLLSNAIKFNTPGGQVIVSTLYEETGEVALRVRDTGPGMSEDDIAKALEPFRQLQTARPGRGTGLGLPLTKALVEANRAIFRIDSTVGQGTLVQVTFPSTRVLAE